MRRECALQETAGHSDRNGEGLSTARTLEKDTTGARADSEAAVGRGCSRRAGAWDQPDIENVAFGVQETEGVRGIGTAAETNRDPHAAVCRTDGVSDGFGVRHRTGRAAQKDVATRQIAVLDGWSLPEHKRGILRDRRRNGVTGKLNARPIFPFNRRFFPGTFATTYRRSY